jgi:hypothetical protein
VRLRCPGPGVRTRRSAPVASLQRPKRRITAPRVARVIVVGSSARPGETNVAVDREVERLGDLDQSGEADAGMVGRLVALDRLPPEANPLGELSLGARPCSRGPARLRPAAGERRACSEGGRQGSHGRRHRSRACGRDCSSLGAVRRLPAHRPRRRRRRFRSWQSAVHPARERTGCAWCCVTDVRAQRCAAAATSSWVSSRQASGCSGRTACSGSSSRIAGCTTGTAPAFGISSRRTSPSRRW